MAKQYHYTTNCVSANGDDISDMVDAAIDITYRTFIKHCEGVRLFADQMGYSRMGLALKNDWHVTYHKSTYRGRPCYFLCHSGIEYIWTAI